MIQEDFRNKIPDFRLQTIGCKAVIAWYLTSYFWRLPYNKASGFFGI
jgi:hypothetical protein